LILGVVLLGWASDYSGIVVSVRTTATASRRSRTGWCRRGRARILFVFIFFYLLLVAGAFVGIMATWPSRSRRRSSASSSSRPMGLLLGQMLVSLRTGSSARTVPHRRLTLIAILGGGWDRGSLQAFNRRLTTCRTGRRS